MSQSDESHSRRRRRRRCRSGASYTFQSIGVEKLGKIDSPPPDRTQNPEMSGKH